jgi:hypothetical protein
VAQKNAEFFDLRRSMADESDGFITAGFSSRTKIYTYVYAELKTAHVHDRT